MLAGLDGNWLLDRIDGGEFDADGPDAGKPLEDRIAAEVAEVQVDVAALESAPLVDFGLNGPGHDVARGQFHGRGRIAAP